MLQSLGISNHLGDQKKKKNFQKKDWPWARRLTVYVLLYHSLTPISMEDAVQHRRKSSSLLFEGQAV